MNTHGKTTLLALILVLPVFGVSAAPAPERQDAASTQNVSRSITVIGSGSVSMVPDIALINVGVEAAAPTVIEAKEIVDSTMEAVSAAIRNAGVERKDIQTSNYSIYFEQDSMDPSMEGRAPGINGRYRVSNAFQVTVRDVDKAGSVLDIAVRAGANQVWGVIFSVSDERAWQSEARRKAMDDAIGKAEELARFAGAELAEVLTVSEVVGGGVSLFKSGYGGGGFEPGELEMGVQLQVTYAIR